MRGLIAVWRALPGVLWPPRCLACDAPGDGDRDLCAACGHGLARPARAPVVAGTQVVTVALAYAPPADGWLRRFKFHGDLAAGRLLAQLLAAAAADAPRPDALVPVPLHRARLRERGYDQALELARPLAAALAVPLLADTLVRVRATTAQTELGARARRRNLQGAFVVRGGVPAHVALVDDVTTTGATLTEAARALRAAGARRVDAWVVAVADRSP